MQLRIPRWNATRRGLPVVALLLVAAAAAGAAGSAGPARAQEKAVPPAAAPPGAAKSKLERGRYLISIMGCNDCHTPKKFGPAGPELDASRLLSGHPEGPTLAPLPAGTLSPAGWTAACNAHMTAWTGPWGTSFAINLTPDPDSGIGSWSEAMFVQALRTGKHMGEGRPILPPMPVAVYANATDEDLSSMFAYLHSLPPVKNTVPDPMPPPASGGGPGK